MIALPSLLPSKELDCVVSCLVEVVPDVSVVGVGFVDVVSIVSDVGLWFVALFVVLPVILLRLILLSWLMAVSPDSVLLLLFNMACAKCLAIFTGYFWQNLVNGILIPATLTLLCCRKNKGS